MNRVPVVLVTGIDDASTASATVGMQFDLSQAAVMRHVLDVRSQRLTRRVSDLTGLVESEDHDLDHACVSCALREDIVPSLERLAASGRWEAIVAHLPVAADASQVCRVLAVDPQAAPHVTITAVVHALDGARVHDDLLGEDLLGERGLHTSEEDSRGVAEAHAALVEYADIVIASGGLDAPSRDLLRALVRPDAEIVEDASALDARRLVTDLHQHHRTERWVDIARAGSLPELDSAHVWRLDLRSTRPLHPGRLLDCVEQIGGGPRRSRGCFWLPTRPGIACEWDGAGGQLSIGTGTSWDRSTPATRIVVTGVDDGADEIRAAFEHCLLTEAEATERGLYWEAAHDGLEPWLGPVRRVA